MPNANARNYRDCILQLKLDFNNTHGRFEDDDQAGVRSRVWRIGTPPRWDKDWKNWGEVLSKGQTKDGFTLGEDSLHLHGVKSDDRFYIVVLVENPPSDHSVQLMAIFSQFDKTSNPREGHCGSPFMDQNDESIHRAFFQVSYGSGSHPDIISLDGQFVRGYYLGWRPNNEKDDLKVRNNFGIQNTFSFSLVARISGYVNENSVTKDFSFDPQLDVAGGD